MLKILFAYSKVAKYEKFNKITQFQNITFLITRLHVVRNVVTDLTHMILPTNARI